MILKDQAQHFSAEILYLRAFGDYAHSIFYGSGTGGWKPSLTFDLYGTESA
jgi:hypothetical protein